MDRSALPMQSACPVENVCYSEKVHSSRFLSETVQIKGRAVLLFFPLESKGITKYVTYNNSWTYGSSVLA